MNKGIMDTSIRYYRKKLKINQSELAQNLGLTNTDMSFIENKKLYPSKELAEKIAEVLKVPIGKLYSEEELNLIIYKNQCMT